MPDAEAETLGFPLLVKAVAGGGGRGMRLAHSAAELPEALAGARREAQAAFGDATLMLERLIAKARHIEIQIFADAHGNAVHLGERDCTAQRRRQKVIEEAPSPIVTPAMREAMGRDAVAAALAVGYRGAGTVEFIVDAELKHYFLEMNTRLQVEHPVTEMITGLDLVEWQLRVAAGEALPLRQEQIRFEGHAIEARLYAEDPYAGFAPQTGTVLHFRPEDALRPGVRIDAGIVEGGKVTPHYDPMLAKVIAHGRNRDDAIRRLIAALEDAPLLGVANNGRFLRDLLDHERFRGATMHTALLDEWAAADEPILQAPRPTEEDWQLAAALFAGPPGWRSDSVASFALTLACGEENRTLEVGAQLRRSNGMSTPTAACATPRTASPATRSCIATATRSTSRARRGGLRLPRSLAAAGRRKPQRPGHRPRQRRRHRRAAGSRRWRHGDRRPDPGRDRSHEDGNARHRRRRRNCDRRARTRRHPGGGRRDTDGTGHRGSPMPAHDKAILTCALTGVLTDPAQYPVPVTPTQMAASAREALMPAPASCTCICASRFRARATCPPGTRKSPPGSSTPSAPPAPASSSTSPPA
jgi:hypothetical protein